jgi:hypothetical protein
LTPDDNAAVVDEIIAATSSDQMDVVRELLRSTRQRSESTCAFKASTSEIRDLPGQYSLPGGRQLLALHQEIRTASSRS